MQPILAVATFMAALSVVAVNSETAYILAPVQPRILKTGWGWKPVKTVTIPLPTLSKGWGGGGWGWGKKPSGITIGVYGGIRIGPKQQGWGKPQGWGWQPPKQQGWGWQPPKQHGWGWQPPKPQGWGWKQQGWGWDDDDDEDDYRSSLIAQAQPLLLNDLPEASSEEIADDDVSTSVESEEADSYEADAPSLDLRNAIYYDPIYA